MEGHLNFTAGAEPSKRLYTSVQSACAGLEQLDRNSPSLSSPSHTCRKILRGVIDLVP